MPLGSQSFGVPFMLTSRISQKILWEKATQQGGGLAPGNVRGTLEELRESHVFHKLLSLKAK